MDNAAIKKTKKISIIGAGFTGLTLAYRLAQQNYKVTLFEKEDVVGGLASSFCINGSTIEKTYHHIFKSDRYIINLAQELNVEINWLESSLANYLDGELHSFSTSIDLLSYSPLSLPSRIRTGLVSLYLQKKMNWTQFENTTAKEWILKYFGTESYKNIWGPLLKAKFGRYHDLISMAWLWARIHTRSSSRQGIFGKEYLGYPEGGFNSILSKLVQKLNYLSVNIVRNSIVESVSVSASDNIELYTNDQKFNFEKVISTVPSPVFAKMISKNQTRKDYIEQLSNTTYIGTVCLVFTSKQSLSNYYWHNINDTSFPFLIFVNHTNFVNKKNYNGKNVYYLGGYYPHNHKYFKISSQELKDQWFDSLKKIFPNFDTKQILETKIFRSKYAQHIVDTKYKEKIPSYRTPIKNIYLANFSQIYPEDRGINYAIQQAEKISKMIQLDYEED